MFEKKSSPLVPLRVNPPFSAFRALCLPLCWLPNPKSGRAVGGTGNTSHGGPSGLAPASHNKLSFSFFSLQGGLPSHGHHDHGIRV